MLTCRALQGLGPLCKSEVWTASAALLDRIKHHEQRDGIDADKCIASFMEAEVKEGEPSSIRTEYLLRVLGLGICADTKVGNALNPACSPGQKKRVTSGSLFWPNMALLPSVE